MNLFSFNSMQDRLEFYLLQLTYEPDSIILKVFLIYVKKNKHLLYHELKIIKNKGGE